MYNFSRGGCRSSDSTATRIYIGKTSCECQSPLKIDPLSPSKIDPPQTSVLFKISTIPIIKHSMAAGHSIGAKRLFFFFPWESLLLSEAVDNCRSLVARTARGRQLSTAERPVASACGKGWVTGMLSTLIHRCRGCLV